MHDTYGQVSHCLPKHAEYFTSLQFLAFELFLTAAMIAMRSYIGILGTLCAYSLGLRYAYLHSYLCISFIVVKTLLKLKFLGLLRRQWQISFLPY